MKNCEEVNLFALAPRIPPPLRPSTPPQREEYSEKCMKREMRLRQGFVLLLSLLLLILSFFSLFFFNIFFSYFSGTRWIFFFFFFSFTFSNLPIFYILQQFVEVEGQRCMNDKKCMYESGEGISLLCTTMCTCRQLVA